MQYQLKIAAAAIIGDMDSILPEVKQYYADRQVELKKYPRRKEFYDTQLALTSACEMGASEIHLAGDSGKKA